MIFNILVSIEFYHFICSQSSNMLNQARLKTLKVREDHVNDVLDEARKRLSQVTNNPDLYREVLKKLILQAILQVSKKKNIYIFSAMWINIEPYI